MLLRRISKHVKDQNWFAVGLDFFIVVVGILIAFQITNWNEGRAEHRKETQALIELKKELEGSIEVVGAKSHAYQQAADAGRRSLSTLARPNDCDKNCWNVLVDFMHASQWQDLNVTLSAYNTMREQGFPENTTIVDAVEVYIQININNSIAINELPVYRSLVRQIISLEAQEFYWDNCWSIKNGLETYVLDCPEGISDAEAKSLVDEIVGNPNIKPHLTQWMGQVVSLSQTLGAQNKAAQEAIDIVKQELERR
ncbi:MAG: hypothetical protein ABJO36_03695 [Litorimonas sp.]